MRMQVLMLLPIVCLQVARGAADEAVQAAAQEHPRLLFGRADVAGLRAKIQQAPWKGMVAKLVSDADKDDGATAPADLSALYDQAILAQRCAFLYVLTGDEAWARKARDMVEKQIADGSVWANGRAKGLTLYMVGSRVAMVYDWCHGASSWEADFSKKVSVALKAHGDVVLKNGGRQQNNSVASNWQGSRYAAAGLCLLATDEPEDAVALNNCYSRVDRWYTANAGSGQTRGWNAEGLGYTYYPVGNFTGPFAMAMARRFPDKDLRKNTAAAWMLWTCYAATVKSSVGMIRPDFGDDNAGTAGEGTYGQAFYFCPPALQPGLVYVYDRLWGTKGGDGSFDPARGGTIFSILYHPGSAVAEKDPLTIPEWMQAFADTAGNGFMTFRNAYGSDRDQVAQMYLKLRSPGGHSGPDALSFRIQGADTAWAVGGGRYGVRHAGGDAYWCSQDTLYPSDPDKGVRTSGQTGKTVGTPVVKADGGGNVVAAIGQSNVGVKNHTRRFIAEFGPTVGAEAAYVLCDTSDNGTFWQLCSLEENTFATQGNTFTLTARNGATMKGTVLYPVGELTFKTGTRPRGSDFITGKNSFVHLQSGDGAFLVVLTVARKGGNHPAATATGTWGKSPDGTVKVGGFTAAIRGDAVTYP